MKTTLIIIVTPFVLVALIGLWVFLMDMRDSFVQRRKEKWIKERERFYPNTLPRMAVYKKDVNYVRPNDEP